MQSRAQPIFAQIDHSRFVDYRARDSRRLLARRLPQAPADKTAAQDGWLRSMKGPKLQYDLMVQNALRAVVREALDIASRHGLPGAHHFYVTFRTDFPGVDIPDFLSAQYPLEMTIVLEHQFWGLEVDDQQFAVTLSFRNQMHRLTVPLQAITSFADPSVEFGLKFPAEDANAAAPRGPAPISLQPAPAAKPAATPLADAAKSDDDTAPRAGEVVKLDLFRKK